MHIGTVWTGNSLSRQEYLGVLSLFVCHERGEPMTSHPKDLPREELMLAADEAIRRYPGAIVHFKFTCQHCGHRCTLAAPTWLYERGKCNECGQLTTITHGGFSLLLSFGSEDSHAKP